MAYRTFLYALMWLSIFNLIYFERGQQIFGNLSIDTKDETKARRKLECQHLPLPKKRLLYKLFISSERNNFFQAGNHMPALILVIDRRWSAHLVFDPLIGPMLSARTLIVIRTARNRSTERYNGLKCP